MIFKLFLLDSGAAVSVVWLRSLSVEDQQAVTKTKLAAVNASGTPLDVRGQIKLVVSIGSFTCEHEFIVIHDLTVDCLLGADFLKKHEAVIDCKSGTLSLGEHIVPLHSEWKPMPLHTDPVINVPIMAMSTQEIPGCTVQWLTCKVKGDVNVAGEGLIKPSDTIGNFPNYLCVTQSLTTVISDNRVILQVMNISPSLIKINKGMKLAQIIPKQNILVVEQSDMETQGSNNCAPETNLDSSLLLCTEKPKLLDLLSEYSNVFATDGTPGAQNHVVKHTSKLARPQDSLSGNHSVEYLWPWKRLLTKKLKKCWNMESYNPVQVHGHPLWWWWKSEMIPGSFALIIGNSMLLHIRMHILFQG